MTNLLNVVEAAGGDKSTILKTTVFLKSMDDFAKVNAVYEKVISPCETHIHLPPLLVLTSTAFIDSPTEPGSLQASSLCRRGCSPAQGRPRRG